MHGDGEGTSGLTPIVQLPSGDGAEGSKRSPSSVSSRSRSLAREQDFAQDREEISPVRVEFDSPTRIATIACVREIASHLSARLGVAGYV